MLANRICMVSNSKKIIIPCIFEYFDNTNTLRDGDDNILMKGISIIDWDCKLNTVYVFGGINDAEGSFPSLAMLDIKYNNGSKIYNEVLFFGGYGTIPPFLEILGFTDYQYVSFKFTRVPDDYDGVSKIEFLFSEG